MNNQRRLPDFLVCALIASLKLSAQLNFILQTRNLDRCALHLMTAATSAEVGLLLLLIYRMNTALLFAFCFWITTALVSCAGRQRAEVIRYRKEDYYKLRPLANRHRGGNVTVHLNCGMGKRECLGGHCFMTFRENGPLTDVQFATFPKFPNCVDAGVKPCTCNKRPWPTPHQLGNPSVSFKYDTDVEVVLLDSSSQSIVVPNGHEKVEFFLFYTAPCCKRLDHWITYANRVPRKNHTENVEITLHDGTGGNVSRHDDVVHIYFSISNVQVDDSGVYTIHVNLETNKFKLIFPFYLTVEGLTVDPPRILEAETGKLVESLFLRVNKSYIISTVAKGNVQNIDFEIFQRKCRLDQCVFIANAADSVKIHLGAYQKEADIRLDAVNQSGLYRIKFGTAEFQTGYYINDLSDSDTASEFGCEIRSRHAVTLEGGDLALNCHLNPDVYDFDHWEVKTDKGPMWVVTERSVNGTFSVEKVAVNANHAYASLRNDNVTTLLSGTYACYLRRKVDDPYHKDTYQKLETYLKVEEPVAPFFNTSTIEHVTTQFTEATTLTCDGFGVPAPIVHWLKDERNLSETDLREEWTSKVLTLKRARSGTYMCVASNRFGVASKTFVVKVEGEPYFRTATELYIALGVLACLGLILIIVVFVLWKKMTSKVKIRRMYRNLMESTKGELPPIDDTKPINRQLDSLPFDVSMEVDKERLLLEHLQVLGEGQFGKVVEGVLMSESNCYAYQVAVKMPKDGSNPVHVKALLSELLIMSHIGNHVNILNVLATVTRWMTRGELYLVVELCKYGSLQSFLQNAAKNGAFVNELAPDDPDGYVRSRRFLTPQNGVVSPSYVNVVSPLLPEGQQRQDQIILTTSDLAKFAYQVANGMEYLSAKNLVHRDLALRNVLLTDRLVVKIADFGLALHDEFNPKKSHIEQLPLKWMALESITHDEFSPMSDVWSFGIVLYEMFTLGEAPYKNHAPNQQFINWLKQGNRMEPPEYAPTIIATIMKQCWMEEPLMRPSFEDAKNAIDKLLRDQFPIAYESLMDLLKTSNFYVNVQQSPVSQKQFAPHDLDNPVYMSTPTMSLNNDGYLSPRSQMTMTTLVQDGHFFPDTPKNHIQQSIL